MINLLSVSILWAFSFSLIKGELSGVDAGFVAFFRLLLSFVVFAPFLPALWRKGRAAFLAAFFSGMVQFGLMYLLYINSFKWLTAWQVALFTVSTPLYVSLMYDLYNRRLNSRNLLAAIIAVTGTGAIVYEPGKSYALTLGFFMIQGANLSFAAGQVAYKIWRNKNRETGDASPMGAFFLGAVSLTLVYVLAFGEIVPRGLETGQWLTLIYLGLVASGLGFFLWNRGATLVNAGTLAVFNNLKIPLAIAVALVFFGEKADIARLTFGGLFVLGALWLTEKKVLYKPGKIDARK